MDSGELPVGFNGNVNRATGATQPPVLTKPSGGAKGPNVFTGNDQKNKNQNF